MGFNLTVDGAPAVKDAPGSVASSWKWKIVEEARRSWNGPPLREPVALSLMFELPRRSYESTALQNLLKHSIDGLAHVLFPEAQDSKRGPWDREDWWVVEFTASKVSAAAPAVTIAVSAPGEHSQPHANEFMARVNGRPRPWATRGEAEWKASIREAVSGELGSTRFESVGLDLEFSLRPAEMARTDIDNLVVPAVAAIADSVVRGTGFPATRIQHLHASKSGASAHAEEGLTVRGWPIRP